MAKKRVQRKLDKWKSKEWYNIVAPKFIGSNHIGVTPTDDPEKLLGRIVETTVGELTNDFSKHNIKLKLEIDNVTGDVANTRFIGHEITTDYLRSIVKRQTSRIDANLNVKTKDGYKIRVKPICFTVKRARTSQIKGLRDVMTETVVKRASELDFEQFVEEAIVGKLSANIYRKSKSIYPLRRVEIRKTEVQVVPPHAVATPVVEEAPVVEETPVVEEAPEVVETTAEE
ncbi:30S ribosomal protein S3ae [Methanococcoides sp. NM1]|uniref:30S ribosomal protein S3ae n=1 Tax=Methanococcoides sp. NM1 TaxID=1201013 RepID=UPI0010823942|nr:30S ribosomal protein S3ae [Methanococcoides sp. NM1]